ncbi:unnamed protein product [Miscanthus lutarioriparius]|uniref:Retrovirus-related Pol polyprotein from transposon TNT 1-94-like beta-barrel domain-containing protein n=1 Tax=Miscanthus lutarioriparius TaxID=422564 RepID=A0A811QED7_9POAL|nr:unnamed protein product [Miscanthus lutarioriparius]
MAAPSRAPWPSPPERETGQHVGDVFMMQGSGNGGSSSNSTDNQSSDHDAVDVKSFIVDSGTSVHATGDLNLFSSLEEDTTTYMLLRTASGATMDITGRGTVRHHNITLHGVLLVPETGQHVGDVFMMQGSGNGGSSSNSRDNQSSDHDAVDVKSFIVDSGASVHATGDLKLFSHLEDTTTNMRLCTASRATMDITGRGSVQHHNITLHGVLLVSGLAVNLFSYLEEDTTTNMRMCGRWTDRYFFKETGQHVGDVFMMQGSGNGGSGSNSRDNQSSDHDAVDVKSFIVDSGASVHATGDPNLFSYLEDTTTNMRLCTANGSTMDITGRGTVRHHNITRHGVGRIVEPNQIFKQIKTYGGGSGSKPDDDIDKMQQQQQHVDSFGTGVHLWPSEVAPTHSVVNEDCLRWETMTAAMNWMNITGSMNCNNNSRCMTVSWMMSLHEERSLEDTYQTSQRTDGAPEIHFTEQKGEPELHRCFSLSLLFIFLSLSLVC